MTRNLWLNLPVKDLNRSRTFFREMGFAFNEKFGGKNEESACMEIGDKPDVIMLFAESTFQNFTQNDVTNTQKSSEVLLSVDAASRHEVDQMAHRAEKAGGVVFATPEEIDGWMYGCGFADVDGHRWNVLYMDMDKMPDQ